MRFKLFLPVWAERWFVCWVVWRMGYGAWLWLKDLIESECGPWSPGARWSIVLLLNAGWADAPNFSWKGNIGGCNWNVDSIIYLLTTATEEEKKSECGAFGSEIVMEDLHWEMIDHDIGDFLSLLFLIFPDHDAWSADTCPSLFSPRRLIMRKNCGSMGRVRRCSAAIWSHADGTVPHQFIWGKRVRRRVFLLSDDL